MLDKERLIRNKILTNETLIPTINRWRLKGEKIVFTNGCFDLLHAGHVTLLLASANLGSKLIVAVNSDDSVRRLKGKTRPVVAQEDRILLLAAQTFVDAVILFDEDTPYNLIAKINPDILVKGGDYKKEQIVGADIVEKNGGEVAIIPLVDGYSTSLMLSKIKNLPE